MKPSREGTTLINSPAVNDRKEDSVSGENDEARAWFEGTCCETVLFSGSNARKRALPECRGNSSERIARYVNFFHRFEYTTFHSKNNVDERPVREIGLVG
jgi:hypothetical protein